MRDFFANGTLPPPDTVCKTNALPFPEDKDVISVSSELRQKMDELELVGKAMDLARRGLPLDSVWDDVKASLARRIV